MTLADRDEGVEVPRAVCKVDSTHPRENLKECSYCGAFFCPSCAKTHDCHSALTALIEKKWPGYTVTHQWSIDDGLHVSIAKSHRDRALLVVADEVIADWSPEQIIARLEEADWLHVLAQGKGQYVAHFTNRGFALKEWPK